jgi:hypothetical protein
MYDNSLKQKGGIDTFNESDIYQLKCNNWSLKYVGQTGRYFRARFIEHKQAIKTIRSSSLYNTY